MIGAGLAGAAACAALSRRGWRLTLLDAAAGAAQAASALPVGMLSPHVTRAPTPLSRLSVLGMPDTLAELRRLVPQGHGWQACEVDNRGHDPGRHPAALVRPAALVQAWLDEAARLTAFSTHWLAPVHTLAREHGAWHALDLQGRRLAQAPVVVVASAFGSRALLVEHGDRVDADHLPLRPVKGQMSLALQQGTPLAPRPQRDKGVFVPLYQDAGLPPRWPAQVWAMGSTYERGHDDTALSVAAHEANACSLAPLCPPAALQLRDALARGTLQGWAQVRCASMDRLPLVGGAPDSAVLRSIATATGRARTSLEDTPRLAGLYLLTALGSRGLTLAHWCATRLASIMDREAPIPEELDLLRAIDPARFAWRHRRRQTPSTRVGA